MKYSDRLVENTINGIMPKLKLKISKELTKDVTLILCKWSMLTEQYNSYDRVFNQIDNRDQENLEEIQNERKKQIEIKK